MGTRTRPVAAQEKPGAGQERGAAQEHYRSSLGTWNKWNPWRCGPGITFPRPEHQNTRHPSLLRNFQGSKLVCKPLCATLCAREKLIPEPLSVPGPGRLGPMRRKQGGFWNDWAPLAALGLLAALGDVCAQIQIANALLDGDHVYRRSHLLPLI